MIYYQELRSYRYKYKSVVVFLQKRQCYDNMLHLQSFIIVKSHTSININNVGEQLLLRDILDLFLVETPSLTFACWTPRTFSSPFAVSELSLL